MKIDKLKTKIEQKEKELKVLKEELKEQSDKSEWLYIPELKIDVQTKIHHKGKILSEAMEDLKEGESVITYEQLRWLRNSTKYRDQLNLLDTWEFVYPNPDKISADNGHVAGFDAGSVGAILNCYWDSRYSYSNLGCRFVRDINNVKKRS